MTFSIVESDPSSKTVRTPEWRCDMREIILIRMNSVLVIDEFVYCEHPCKQRDFVVCFKFLGDHRRIFHLMSDLLLISLRFRAIALANSPTILPTNANIIFSRTYHGFISRFIMLICMFWLVREFTYLALSSPKPNAQSLPLVGSRFHAWSVSTKSHNRSMLKAYVGTKPW